MSGLGERTGGRGRQRLLFEASRRQGAPAVVYHAANDRWWLWWPCVACGGAALPLRDRAGVEGSVLTPPSLIPPSGPLPCPGCETRRKRLESAGTGPTVW